MLQESERVTGEPARHPNDVQPRATEAYPQIGRQQPTAGVDVDQHC